MFRPNVSLCDSTSAVRYTKGGLRMRLIKVESWRRKLLLPVPNVMSRQVQTKETGEARTMQDTGMTFLQERSE